MPDAPIGLDDSTPPEVFHGMSPSNAVAPDSVSFPGPGRGYFAWQRDGIGPGQESVALMLRDRTTAREQTSQRK